MIWSIVQTTNEGSCKYPGNWKNKNTKPGILISSDPLKKKYKIYQYNGSFRSKCAFVVMARTDRKTNPNHVACKKWFLSNLCQPKHRDKNIYRLLFSSWQLSSGDTKTESVKDKTLCRDLQVFRWGKARLMPFWCHESQWFEKQILWKVVDNMKFVPWCSVVEFRLPSWFGNLRRHHDGQSCHKRLCDSTSAGCNAWIEEQMNECDE